MLNIRITPGLRRIVALGSSVTVHAPTCPVSLRRLWWAAVVLLGLSVGAVGWTVWQLRTDAIHAAISDSGNIATVMAGQLVRSLRAVDAALLDVKSSSASLPLENASDLRAHFGNRAFHGYLSDYLVRLPHIFNIAIADANGDVIASTAAWPPPAVNVADRDYFQDARTRLDGRWSTSVPINNRIDGTRTIVFARRLEGARGDFVGVVYASVNSSYFENFYASIQSLHSFMFTLVRQDGTILFRHPERVDFTGRKLSAESAWLESLARGANGFRVVAQADGNVRFVSTRKIAEYPLFVNISVTEETALATWRQRAIAIGLGSSVLLLCSLYFLLSVTRQVRSLRTSQTSLAHMARYDTLTGLANRALFLKEVNEAVARARRHGDEFALLMLDLDRFKAVNDLLGHAVGDSLLKIVGERLQSVMTGGALVSRLGGDEFAVLVPVTQAGQGPVFALADAILEVLTAPYDLRSRKIVIGASIGIAFAPADARNADTLIRNADLALYKAKAEGRNRYRSFEPAMAAEAREWRELEDAMRKGIARNEFELHYQTIVDLEKGTCCGAEALLRWRHPERGLILPDQFIGLAEASGLIVPLGEWILRRACADAVAWPAHMRLAVNLSPVQIAEGDLLDRLASVLADTGLPPERLELEITETILVEKNENNLAVLHALKDLGVSIVLDDFGIGYSSMRYLQIFPFDKIKIDRSFIQSMASDADSTAIVCAITGLGRSLGIDTTAEGVETAEQLTLLRGAACRLAQGYLFSRPVPATELAFEPPPALRDTTRAA